MARDAKRPQATARASSGCLVSSLSLSDSPFSDSPNRQPAVQARTVEPAQLELNGTAARGLERDSGARPGGGETWRGGDAAPTEAMVVVVWRRRQQQVLVCVAVAAHSLTGPPAHTYTYTRARARARTHTHYRRSLRRKAETLNK